MNNVIDLKHKPAPRRALSSAWIVILVAVMVTTVGIKAADLTFNQKTEKNNPDGCPLDMVRVLSAGGGFCIDRFEAAADSRCPFISPNSQADSRLNLETAACRPVSIKGVVPWRYLSQNQAEEACAKAGKRLPTAKEWRLAALGTPDIATNWASEDCQVAKNWSSQPGNAGAGKNCVSSAGAYDMIGNVWEWVQGTVRDGKIDNIVLPGQGFVASVNDNGLPGQTSGVADENYHQDYFYIKSSGERAIARGGYWDNKQAAGVDAAYLVLPPSFADSGIGFRCVK
ncbi:MAG: SUMF1/EgtB/PvdO family nonheme iron enzyme [Candidatus Falkowbacteria bacterium]